MRRITRLNIALFIGSVVVFGVGSMIAWAERGGSRDDDHGQKLRASAEIVGPGIRGEVRLTQTDVTRSHPVGSVKVVARVKGLAPGLHGFHIHENGTCDPPEFASAGGHFDPGPFGHSTPVDLNHPYHMGDLPNLRVNEHGVGHLRHRTSRITLSPGPLAIFDANGSAVIVHLNPDLGTTGVTGASGGPRVACGVIQPD